MRLAAKDKKKSKRISTIAGSFDTLIGLTINENESRSMATLRSGDILLEPDTGKVGTVDFVQLTETIKAGEEIANAVLDQLKPLALTEKEFAQYLEKRKPVPLITNQ